MNDDDLRQWENNRGEPVDQTTAATNDARTIMEDAQDQLRGFHVGHRPAELTQEEKRAREVAQCALAAVHDTARMCGRAGLIGVAITEELDNAEAALLRVIATIEGRT